MHVRFRLPDNTTKSGLPEGHPGDDVTAKTLSASIASTWLGGIDPSRVTILAGFPPKPLAEAESIQRGDTCIVRVSEEEKKNEKEKEIGSEVPVDPGNTGGGDDTTRNVNNNDLGPSNNNNSSGNNINIATLQRDIAAPHPTTLIEPSMMEAVVRKVPNDNSCLFSSIAYVTAQNPASRRDVIRGDRLRFIVKEIIAGDIPPPSCDNFPEISASMLGQPRSEYARWIADGRHWGGEIELSILAPVLQCEICVLHAQPNKMIRYGRGYNGRCFIVYDGLHYDPVAFTIKTGTTESFPESEDITVVSAEDAGANISAEMLLEEFHQQRKFTDTTSFTLRCGDCGAGLTGERGAIEHSTNTGHINFQEYIQYE